MTRRTAPTLAPLALLGGCFSFGADPPAELLTLTPSAAVAPGTSQAAGAGEAITIVTPTVPAALATPRVPVYASDTSIAYVKDTQWVEQPNKLFQRLLSETVAARTGRPVLSPRQFSFDPGTRIAGQLVNFGIDAASRQAVVTFDAAVSRQGGASVETRRFEARTPVAEIERAAVGAALNDAANRVAGDVAAWIGG